MFAIGARIREQRFLNRVERRRSEEAFGRGNEGVQREGERCEEVKERETEELGLT